MIEALMSVWIESISVSFFMRGLLVRSTYLAATLLLDGNICCILEKKLAIPCAITNMDCLAAFTVIAQDDVILGTMYCIHHESFTVEQTLGGNP